MHASQARRSVRGLGALSVVAGILAALVVAVVPAADAQGGPVVYRVRIDGVVTHGTLLQVEEGLDRASEARAPLVIELDTPGGLVDATLDIHKAVVRSDVPVLTFVGPQGAFAASAGTFLLLMGHPSGMAPGTQIGSAQPIEVGPTGGAEAAGEKIENFLAERIRQIAETNGRNGTLAARFVTENLNLDERQALETGLIDVVATDLDAFLAEVDGRPARVGDGEAVLRTRDARVVDVGPTLLVRTIDLLSNPQIAFLLFIVGLYALIFGLANPGTVVPETVGAVLLLLAIVGFGFVSLGTAGILLLLLSVGFFVAEVFTPTNGALTVAGVAALALAVVFLVDEPLLPAGLLQEFRIIGWGAAAFTGIVVFAAVTLAWRTRRRPSPPVMIGERGVALSALDPVGQVRVHGETWRARAGSGALAEGAAVQVTARDGLTLVVEPLADPAVPGDAAKQTTKD